MAATAEILLARLFDAASFHFGFIATYSGVGLEIALRGGGALSELRYRNGIHPSTLCYEMPV
jgi:hypothetical protein